MIRERALSTGLSLIVDQQHFVTRLQHSTRLSRDLLSPNVRGIMSTRLKAQAIQQTLACHDRSHLVVTLADAEGRVQELSVTPELAATLAQVLSEFASESNIVASGPEPTKLPTRFAVGTGRYENLVLIRFEEDAPYALKNRDAEELGRELIKQSRLLAARPHLTRQ